MGFAQHSFSRLPQRGVRWHHALVLMAWVWVLWLPTGDPGYFPISGGDTLPLGPIVPVAVLSVIANLHADTSSVVTP